MTADFNPEIRCSVDPIDTPAGPRYRIAIYYERTAKTSQGPQVQREFASVLYLTSGEATALFVALFERFKAEGSTR